MSEGKLVYGEANGDVLITLKTFTVYLNGNLKCYGCIKEGHSGLCFLLFSVL